MKAILSATCAAILFATSLPSTAAMAAPETQSVGVSYSDLNLTGAHGVSTLEQRVTKAVHQVCDGPAFDLNQKMQQQACTRAAESSARSGIQNAISSAKQLPTTNSTATVSTSAIARTSSSGREHLNTHKLLPRR